MLIDLSDKVALVTGSAQRVGRVIALELAKHGVHIQVHYHSASDDVVRDTLHDIKSEGVDAFAVQADISTPEGVNTVMDAVKENFGRLDILINSASVFPAKELLDITVDSWDLTMNVNLRAPFLFTQAATPLMLENDPPGGCIVNICDQGAIAPWPKRPDHGVSKAALWMLTQTTAVSLGPEIRVNAIAPGPIMKPPEGMSDDKWSTMGRSLPLQRTGSPEDVARAILYLCQNSFVTGVLLPVNGGEHLQVPHGSPSS